MLKIHTDDGQTSHIDLADSEQAKVWLARLRDLNLQKSITGATLVQKTNGRFKCPSCRAAGRYECAKCGKGNAEFDGPGVQYSLARPEGFSQVFYWPELVEPDEETKAKGGEKIVCFVDDIRLTLMVHRSQPSVRVSLMKTGKLRFNPQSRE